MSKNIEVIKKGVLVEKAEALFIKSASDMAEAVEMLSKLNKYSDNITAEKEKLTKPLNATLKEIRSRYKPVEEVLETAISLIRNKIGAYQTKQLAIASAKQEKIADKVADGKLSVEKAVSKLEAIDTPQTAVETASGSLRFRADKILKITNRSLIPHEFYDLNEKRVLDALKDGKTVPGAEIEVIQVPINTR